MAPMGYRGTEGQTYRLNTKEYHSAASYHSEGHGYYSVGDDFKSVIYEVLYASFKVDLKPN